MLLRMVLSSYLIKVAVEVVATPVTYLVVGWLKRAEAVDAFDDTDQLQSLRVAGRERLMNRFAARTQARCRVFLRQWQTARRQIESGFIFHVRPPSGRHTLRARHNPQRGKALSS